MWTKKHPVVSIDSVYACKDHAQAKKQETKLYYILRDTYGLHRIRGAGNTGTQQRTFRLIKSIKHKTLDLRSLEKDTDVKRRKYKKLKPSFGKYYVSKDKDR